MRVGALRVEEVETDRPRLRLVIGAAPMDIILSVADKAAPSFAALLLRAAGAGKRELNLDALEKALSLQDLRTSESVMLAAVTVTTRMLEKQLPRLVQAVIGASGEALARQAARRGTLRFAKKGDPISDLHFDLVNPEAVDWAQKRSASLIRGLTKETRAAIQRSISRSFTEGIPVKPLARILREQIGLDQRQAAAVMNLRKAIDKHPGALIWAGRSPIRVPEGGATAEFTQRRIGQYADRLLNFRAQRIARTETMAASNEGQRQLWMQSVDNGYLRGDELREWIITGDKRICPICEGSAGDLAPLTAAFPNGLMGPPAHPMCRCTTGLSRERGKKAVKVAEPIRRSSPAATLDRLDKLLAEGPNDTFFATTNNNMIQFEPTVAQQVKDTFPARVRAYKRMKIDVDFKLPRGQGGRRVEEWTTDVTTAEGRARVSAMNTTLNEIRPAVERMRAAGALGAKERLQIGFYESTTDSASAHAWGIGKHRIEINMKQSMWQTDASYARANQSFRDTNHAVGDIITHETGHVRHSRVMQEAWKESQEAVRRSVSGSMGNVTSVTYDRYAQNVADGWRRAEWDQVFEDLAAKSKARYDTLPQSLLRAQDQAAIGKEIAREVSRYAAKNTAEFVAETFTGLVNGRKYSTDVLELYKALGGAEVKFVAKVEGGLAKQVARILPRSPVVALPPTTMPPVVTRTLPEPVVPKIVKTPKAIRPIPTDEVGAEIRRVHELRQKGGDYTAIAKEMGWDTTRRAKGWGVGPQRVFDIIKKYGDPLERVAAKPIGSAVAGELRAPVTLPAAGPGGEWSPYRPVPKAPEVPEFDPGKLGKGATTFHDRVGSLHAEFLEGEEFNVIDRYAHVYSKLNNLLRGTAKQAATVEKTAHALSTAIRKFTTTADATVFRGGLLPSGLKKGATFVDKGFVSTSLKENVAKRFAKRAGADGRVFEIILPKGSNALPIQTRFVQDEFEVLLNRGHTFEVVHMDAHRVVLRLIK